MLAGIVRILSGFCMVAIGVGLLAQVSDIEPPAVKAALIVIAVVSAVLGVYVLVGDLRRRREREDNGDST